MKKKFLFQKTMVVLAIMMIISLACSLPGESNNQQNNSQAVDLEQTQIALSVQSTQLALQFMQATLNAGQNNNQVQQQPEQQATYTPLPTYTPYPEQEEPSQPTSDPGLSMDEKIRGANVLIFEDIAGATYVMGADGLVNLSGDKRVSAAVNSVGFSGGRVINDADAVGHFKEHLNSSTKWDLIITSSENRSTIQGEFWDYIMQHVDRKTALIAEVWYLDTTAGGKVSNLLRDCGVDFQKNWTRPNNYDMLDYSILWYIPDHPMLTSPNSGISLASPSYLVWMGDAGDLMRLSGSGDAQMVAGINLNTKSERGVLATCMEGRTAILTFSTHDYKGTEVTKLWENMIIYTLTNHFNTMEQ